MRIRTGDLVLDTDRKTVEVAGTPVRLTRKEFRILELLSLHKDAAVQRTTLFDDLYRDVDGPPEIRIIDVFVAVVRKKLAHASGGALYIAAVGDEAFRLSAPPTASSQA